VPEPAHHLHARTVALEYGPDALQFDGHPTVLFDRPGLTLVGWGTAMLVEARHAAGLLSSIPCEDHVARPGSGVVALGALPFLTAAAGHLVIPRFVMGIGRDGDGATHRWATAVGADDTALPETDELFESVLWQYGTGPGDHAPAADDERDSEVTALEPLMDARGYRTMVAGVVARLSAPHSTLRKVVLSRAVEVRLARPLPLSHVLRRLRAHEPDCTVFSMPVPEGNFFGATPELLIARRGAQVWCHPLAGTVARGDTARSDAAAQGRLAGSPKERAEHRYVVDAVTSALEPLCEELTVPKDPSLVAFRSVAHLGTRITGRLHADRVQPTVVEILELVHPTPAVGGAPRDEALATIAAAESGRRGYWAGPVGWVDGQGDGEWMIGIRSALVDPDGTRVTLRAGAGIVADSLPDAETAETDVKLATVLESLVPGGSVHLR